MNNNLVGFVGVLSIALLLLPAGVLAQEEKVCAVYFTGVGCPHCAVSDPVVLGELTSDYDNLVVIEYEIYQQQQNGPLLFGYHNSYQSGMGVPLLIFGEGEAMIGDMPILSAVRGTIESKSAQGNPCPLIDGSSADFDGLDISGLPGLPKIWANGRILMRTRAGEVPSNVLRDLPVSGNLSASVKAARDAGVDVEKAAAFPVALSGSQISFEYAVEVGGSWVLQCRECPEIEGPREGSANQTPGEQPEEGRYSYITQSGDSTTLVVLLVFLLILISVFSVFFGKKVKRRRAKGNGP